MVISEAIEAPDEDLQKLHTRELLHLFRLSKTSWISCSCGRRYHCGDDVLSEWELEYNKNLDVLTDRLKKILDTREHVPSPAEAKRERLRMINFNRPPEKKKMKY